MHRGSADSRLTCPTASVMSLLAAATPHAQTQLPASLLNTSPVIHANCLLLAVQAKHLRVILDSALSLTCLTLSGRNPVVFMFRIYQESKHFTHLLCYQPDLLS